MKNKIQSLITLAVDPHNSTEKSATLSECRTYRYALWRFWDKSKPFCLFIGLNPSTADETTDDPTIRRCVNFAKSWGYGGLCMANLFAVRATDPTDMLVHPNPIGDRNDLWLQALVERAGKVVAAWGTKGGHLKRDTRVMALIGQAHCLSETKAGHPGHPLYIKSDTQLKPYEGRQ